MPNKDSGSEAGGCSGDSACSGDTAAQDKAAPAPAGAVGSAAPPAQLPGASSDGLGAPSSANKGGSSEQPARAEHQAVPQLTWAGVQQALDTGRVTRAAAALDDMQKEAEQAEAWSKCMLEYLQLGKVYTWIRCAAAKGEADLLYKRAKKWTSAQGAMLESLVWAVSRTREHLDGILESWEGRLQAFFGGEAGLQQAVAEDVSELVRGYSGGIGSMARCYEALQARYAGFLRDAKAHQEWTASAMYTLIRLVRCSAPVMPSQCAGKAVHSGSEVCVGSPQGLYERPVSLCRCSPAAVPPSSDQPHAAPLPTLLRTGLQTTAVCRQPLSRHAQRIPTAMGTARLLAECRPPSRRQARSKLRRAWRPAGAAALVQGGAADGVGAPHCTCWARMRRPRRAVSW